LNSIIHKGKLVPDYLIHKLTAKSSVGHGVHSPFVYNFIREVIRENNEITPPSIIEKIHQDNLNSNIPISIQTLGAKSISLSENSKLGSVVRLSSVTPKIGKLLYRISHWVNPRYILEIGTSVGISTMYIAAATPFAKITTLEGNPDKIEQALKNFSLSSLNNITLIEGDFNLTLNMALSSQPRLDMVFFDGNHQTEPTLHYFKQCLELSHDKSVFIFDDIRWSKEMFNTWQIIKGHKSVSISIDLFNMGILFFREGISKQHFKVNF